jgi:DNA polymerase-4
MERHIIHIHIPAFAIAVERAARPELRDRPVVVAWGETERASVLCVSAEARREGVAKGMPLGRARYVCPDIKVLRPDLTRTEKAGNLLGNVVARYTPLWEPPRPGHVYMDVTGTARLWGRAKDTAERVRRDILDRLRLTGAAGVAGNKMVSSIASRIHATPATLDVDHGREGAFIAPLRAGVLPGIGPVRKRLLLEELGITLVREVAALEVGDLRLLFGRQAFVLHQRALGIDNTPVYPPTKKPLIQEEKTLTEDENDDQRLLGALYEMVERCARRLRERNLAPRQGGLLIRYADQREVTRRVTLSGRSAWDMDLYAPLEEAFHRACLRRVRVRLMRIWFTDLVLPEGRQLSLFAFRPSPGEQRAGVTRALDRIRERYGDEAIRARV